MEVDTCCATSRCKVWTSQSSGQHAGFIASFCSITSSRFLASCIPPLCDVCKPFSGTRGAGNRYVICMYERTQLAQLTFIFEGQPSKTRRLGMYESTQMPGQTVKAFLSSHNCQSLSLCCLHLGSCLPLKIDGFGRQALPFGARPTF